MKLEEAVRLIENPELIRHNAHWMDLGCGNGLFTHALANELITGSRIEAIDKSAGQLHPYPNPNKVQITRHQLNFLTDKIPFHQLDGILMANALHYVEQPLPFLQSLSIRLNAMGQVMIVEYDTSKANPWVPYPLPFERLKAISTNAGFADITKLHQMPSVYNNGPIYAALIKKQSA